MSTSSGEKHETGKVKQSFKRNMAKGLLCGRRVHASFSAPQTWSECLLLHTRVGRGLPLRSFPSDEKARVKEGVGKAMSVLQVGKWRQPARPSILCGKAGTTRRRALPSQVFPASCELPR